MGVLHPWASVPTINSLGWTFHAVVSSDDHDGDTVPVDCLVDIGFEEMVTRRRRIRLLDVDSPETRTGTTADRVLGRLAAEFCRSLVPAGATVIVTVVKHDKYGGRDLGYIRLLDGSDLSMQLLQAGHAVPYDGGAR